MSTLRPDTGGRAYWRSLDQLADIKQGAAFGHQRQPRAGPTLLQFITRYRMPHVSLLLLMCC